MRLKALTAINFGSYSDLSIDLLGKGLSLISGPTGSGKSTIQNAILWCLFGIIAKDVNADEVRSWNVEQENTRVQIDADEIEITRVRGYKTSENDLYWTDTHGDKFRGKDLKDTQRLLEQRLGVTSDLFLAAACYNEFSPTTTFFTDKAKDRRELFDKISDLALPIKLTERVVNERKEVRKTIVEVTKTVDQTRGRLEGVRDSEAKTTRDAERWNENQARSIEALEKKSQRLEEEKAAQLSAAKAKYDAWEEQRRSKINALNESKERHLHKKVAEPCPTCNSGADAYEAHFNEILDLDRRIQDRIAEVNPYETVVINGLENSYLRHILDLKEQVNPFITTINYLQLELKELEQKIGVSEKILAAKTSTLLSLDTLYDVSLELRGQLLKTAIKFIESDTNKHLEAYFDSEIRVEFNLETADDLTVLLHKDGHSCSFKQLSKGQRSLLKLCFAVSIMKYSADRKGVHFNLLFFDEALDGLDDELKVKAYSLFSELEKSHETIFVVDHSEALKSLFSSKFQVELTDKGSEITEI